MVFCQQLDDSIVENAAVLCSLLLLCGCLPGLGRACCVCAVCRFAQFFISPLISADGVEREVKAVDSEVRGTGNGWGSILVVTGMVSVVSRPTSRRLTGVGHAVAWPTKVCALLDHQFLQCWQQQCALLPAFEMLMCNHHVGVSVLWAGCWGCAIFVLGFFYRCVLRVSLRMCVGLCLQHGKNINVDAWRLHQLAKATANQEHAWSRFFTGELQEQQQSSSSKPMAPSVVQDIPGGLQGTAGGARAFTCR